MQLPADAFKYYDEAKKQWVLEPGQFEVLVGAASDDIRQRGSLTL
jgi:beta-glucosidase